MAEVAVIAASKTRLRKLAESGNARARTVLQLAAEPNRFLSSMLVGVTALTLLAGGVALTGLADPMAAALERLPGVGRLAEWLAYPAVLAVVTLASLAIADFLPQRLAAAKPDAVALSLARVVGLAHRVMAPFASLVLGPVNVLLGWFGLTAMREARVSDDDIKTLVERGLSSGSIHKAEKEMVEGVLALDALPVTAIMTPRPKIVWINADDPEETNWRKIVASGHSHFPVYTDNYDHVLGILTVKALWANAAIGLRTPLRDLLAPAVVVPETMTSIQLLETLKKATRHCALVVDEFGSVQGMVTMFDVLEAIVGDLAQAGPRTEPEARQREDGSWLIDATLPVVDIKEMFALETLPQEDADYQTLGGLVVTHLGRIPQVGDKFEWGGFRFEVTDMDRHRVDRVLVTRIAEPAVALDERVAS